MYEDNVIQVFSFPRIVCNNLHTNEYYYYVTSYLLLDGDFHVKEKRMDFITIFIGTLFMRPNLLSFITENSYHIKILALFFSSNKIEFRTKIPNWFIKVISF